MPKHQVPLFNDPDSDAHRAKPSSPRRTRLALGFILRVLPATLVVMALCTISTISVVAFEEARAIDVTVQARQLNDVTLISTTANNLAPAHQGFVIFDFLGAISRSVISLQLKIRSAREAVWYSQSCCQISNGAFFGTAQLGSQQRPLYESQQYTFQLVSAPGDRVLAEGTIYADVTTIDTTPSWVRLAMVWLGALAAIMQLGQVGRLVFLTIRTRSPKARGDRNGDEREPENHVGVSIDDAGGRFERML